MIVMVTPELFDIGYRKKSEAAGARKPRNPKKSLLRSAAWPITPVRADDRTTVISSGLCSDEWKRLKDETRARMYQLALNEAGRSYPFTLNFDKRLIARAKATKKPFSTWANERLSEYLKPLEQHYGYKLPFWFAIEVSPTDVYHLHGAIGMNSNQKPEVERLLKKVAGTSDTGAHRWFVRVKEFDPTKHYQGFYGSSGWVAYSVKQLRQTESLRVGSPLVVRHGLKAAARDIWNELRREDRRRGVEVILGRSLSEAPETLPGAHVASFVLPDIRFRLAAFPVAL